jgi:hypothetical protein
MASPGGILLQIEFENREFDRVVPDGFNIVEQRQQTVAERVGPQKQVDTVLHMDISSPLISSRRP